MPPAARRLIFREEEEADSFSAGFVMQNDRLRVGIYTLGCRVNQYESEAVAEIFQKSGYAVMPFDSLCDVYVINTCTVTAESDRKSRQFIRRAASQNPDAIIVVTGCYAQVSPDKAAKIDGVDIVCGNSNKSMIPNFVDDCLKLKKSETLICTGDIMQTPFEQMRIEASPDNRTRAFVKIEDGCESRCAYCIIPQARGRVRSKAPEDVCSEIRGLAGSGCREVVLTGIETASYGVDFQNRYRLPDLLRDVNKIDGIERIRLGSLDPSVMDIRFAEEISHLKKIMPHFHLSMQSGSSRILNLMRRKYTADTALKNMERLRNLIPGVMFTTDMMTGFPSETDEDFAETLDFCTRAMFLKIHVFTYSKRTGTEAERMPNQVDEHIKRMRSARLSAQNEKIRKTLLREFLEKNKYAEILFESAENGISVGHTKNFIETSVKTERNFNGEIKTVNLTGTDGQTLFGEIVS